MQLSEQMATLFFAKDLSAFYPHASIHCFRFSGIDGMDVNSMGDSRRINPVVADFMHKAGYVEKAGTGLKKIQKLIKDAGQPADINIHNFHWQLTFPVESKEKIFSNDVKFNFDDRSLTSKRADRLSSLLNLIAIRKFEKSSFAKNRAISHRTVEE